MSQVPSAPRVFEDRLDAARQLAQHPHLQKYKNDPDTLLLALPRGGVPMGHEISQVLNLPLDMVVPRKIGHPRNPEVALGAITEAGVEYWNDSFMRSCNYTPQDVNIRRIVEQEQREAQRRLTTYRQGRPALQLQGKRVILVDDGIATGATMIAAIISAKAKGAVHVTVAVPVISGDRVADFQRRADELVVLSAPNDFHAVGQYYQIFDQTTDREVMEVMRDQWRHSQQRAATVASTSSSSAGKATAEQQEEKMSSYERKTRSSR